MELRCRLVIRRRFSIARTAVLGHIFAACLPLIRRPPSELGRRANGVPDYLYLLLSSGQLVPGSYFQGGIDLPTGPQRQGVPCLRAAPTTYSQSPYQPSTLPGDVRYKSATHAPPPVETWLSLSSTPYFAATVAVSPPPMMTIFPFWAASTAASSVAFVPLAKASNSNTPGGLSQSVPHISFLTDSHYDLRRKSHPFHKMVFASPIVSLYSFTLFSPQSKPIHPSGIPSLSSAYPVLASLSNLSAVM